jgi:hypothetical protein
MRAEAGRQLPMARLALALYPPAWRDRYGDEVLALLAQSGGGVRAAASLAWHAISAWICPARNVYEDRTARMRASLGTVPLAWSLLFCLGLLFYQVTQRQGVIPPVFSYQRWKTPASQLTWVTSYAHTAAWSYRVFDVAMAASVLAMVVGGLPLWLLMLRRARREHRRRDLVRLLMPVLAPGLWLAAVGITATVLHSPGGLSPDWFRAFVVTGFAAGMAAAAGPGIAMRSLRPRGPAVEFASRAAVLGVASICIAALAAGTAAVTMHLFTSGPGDFSSPSPLRIIVQGVLTNQQYASTAMLVLYLVLLAVPAVVAALSAGRGARAALAGSRPKMAQP